MTNANGADTDKTSYVSELTTTHLVKQDDVGMTNVNDIDTDIAIDIAISNNKTNYVSELRTTHLVKQDDVGMTVVVDIDTDIGHGDLLS